MKRVVIIGGGRSSMQIAALVEILGFEAVRTVKDFRELVETYPAIDATAPRMQTTPAAKFGGDRAYLKKKKGRS